MKCDTYNIHTYMQRGRQGRAWIELVCAAWFATKGMGGAQRQLKVLKCRIFINLVLVFHAADLFSQPHVGAVSLSLTQNHCRKCKCEFRQQKLVYKQEKTNQKMKIKIKNIKNKKCISITFLRAGL